jgi:hypothetical protein
LHFFACPLQFRLPDLTGNPTITLHYQKPQKQEAASLVNQGPTEPKEDWVARQLNITSTVYFLLRTDCRKNRPEPLAPEPSLDTIFRCPGDIWRSSPIDAPEESQTIFTN